MFLKAIRRFLHQRCIPAMAGLWLGNFAVPLTAGDEGAGAAAAGAKPPDSLMQIIFSGGPIGIGIMLTLIGLSLTAAYLVFENSFSIRRRILLPEGLAEQVRQTVMAGRFSEAEQACRQQPSFLSFVLLHGLAEAEGGWAAVEKALEEALAEQTARLFRRIEYLSVLANLAPMLGLLGTVFGMVLCFRQVASTQGNAGAAQLADGIYQALVTTVAGLIIAIPSLAAFAILRNRVDQYVAEAAYLAQHAFASLKRRPRPAPAVKSTAAAPSTPPPPPEVSR
jgi:biopolymer transport protein ExbB